MSSLPSYKTNKTNYQTILKNLKKQLKKKYIKKLPPKPTPMQMKKKQKNNLKDNQKMPKECSKIIKINSKYFRKKRIRINLVQMTYLKWKPPSNKNKLLSKNSMMILKLWPLSNANKKK